jgi:excisionase family DNA binding protein
MDKITVTAAAALLGVTPQRVRHMIKAGILEAEKWGRDWQVSAESVGRRRQKMARTATAIWDGENNGWFVRLEFDGKSIDSLPPSIATYDNEPNATDEDIMEVIDEAIQWETKEEPGKWGKKIQR